MNPRVNLITDANGGLGQAMARSFLQQSVENQFWLGIHAPVDQAAKLAREAARIGITVNATCPGYVDPATLAMGAMERKGAMARIPMRRCIQSCQVAAAVRFLASRHASCITGSSLKIDGGKF